MMEMEKSLKFTANELLDSFNREFSQDEMNEIYKALIAYSLNLQEITPETDAKLDEVIDYYFDNDAIVGMVNTDIIEKADEILFDNL
jgi:hypothetical protein